MQMKYFDELEKLEKNLVVNILTVLNRCSCLLNVKFTVVLTKVFMVH